MSTLKSGGPGMPAERDGSRNLTRAHRADGARDGRPVATPFQPARCPPDVVDGDERSSAKEKNQRKQQQCQFEGYTLSRRNYPSRPIHTC